MIEIAIDEIRIAANKKYPFGFGQVLSLLATIIPAHIALEMIGYGHSVFKALPYILQALLFLGLFVAFEVQRYRLKKLYFKLRLKEYLQDRFKITDLEKRYE